LPFALAPVASLLERHPRHRTSHSTLLSEITDLLSGPWTFARQTTASVMRISDASRSSALVSPKRGTGGGCVTRACLCLKEPRLGSHGEGVLAGQKGLHPLGFTEARECLLGLALHRPGDQRREMPNRVNRC
jgi:hypothetical protein